MGSISLRPEATIWHVARHRKNSRRLNSENQSGCREQSPCSDENPLARGCCTSEEYRDGGRSCFPRHCCSWHIDGWSPSSSGNPAAAAGRSEEHTSELQSPIDISYAV